MPELISICIPTCKRPAQLLASVKSCIQQAYRPIELVVGDDSPTPSAEGSIRKLADDAKVLCRYMHHQSPLGQARNVNSLFDAAEGHRLVLLHDDDLLLPGALNKMDQAWRNADSVSAVYGKQILITEDDERLPDESFELNRYYYRDPQYAGDCLTPLQAALVQQFPNDGYLVDSNLARKVRYRDESELGTTRWCDYEFSIRFAREANRFVYLDELTSCYRLSIEAVSRHGRPTYMYPLVNSLEVPAGCEWSRTVALSRLAPMVTANYLAIGDWKTAVSVYAAPHYGWRNRLSARGLIHLAKMGMAVSTRSIFSMAPSSPLSSAKGTLP